jgi:DNA-directed RNA polymerase subunit RPC12/RpoP
MSKDYICSFCNKPLVIEKNFINLNDYIQCSNCKNTFKFIPENLEKHVDEIKNIRGIVLNLFYRFLITIVIFFAYFIIYPEFQTFKSYFFISINTVPFLAGILICYFKKEKLIDYSLIFKDKYCFTFEFWIVLSEIILTFILNFVFFIID